MFLIFVLCVRMLICWMNADSYPQLAVALLHFATVKAAFILGLLFSLAFAYAIVEAILTYVEAAFSLCGSVTGQSRATAFIIKLVHWVAYIINLPCMLCSSCC